MGRSGGGRVVGLRKCDRDGMERDGRERGKECVLSACSLGLMVREGWRGGWREG